MTRFNALVTSALLAAAAAASSPAIAQTPAITLSGVVQRVGTHTLDVWEPARHTSGTWVVGNAGAFRSGERVTGTGTEDRFGHFYPRSVSILAQGNRITLSATVQRVGTHTIAVWETRRRETGEWIVGNAARFRVGEHVTGTGTEDRQGRFYPTNVSVW